MRVATAKQSVADAGPPNATAVSKPRLRRGMRRSIFARTVLLSWGFIVVVLGSFVLAIFPYQKRILIRSLESRAEVVATSIAQVTVTSVVVDAYANVVEHCRNVVAERPSILYVVVTRKDGFTLLHHRDGWRMEESMGGIWRTQKEWESRGRFIYSPLVASRVFHYSYPLSYSGIDWGWIHIGLSPEEFDADLRSMMGRSALITILAILNGLAAAFLFGRTISRPILELDAVAHRIAGGDLSARVELTTGDELERLGESFNDMTTELRRSQEDLLASLREKEVLLKEVHHRVKNNLQVISSLLNLQSGYVDDAQALEMFRDSQNRVRSMALVHEKLYQSDDLARIDFAEYVADLTRELFRSYGPSAAATELTLDINDAYLSVDVAIPCGLVINELVSNSLKHAFPDARQGRIDLALKRNEVGWTLLVSDNGIGIPDDIDIHNTESLGLQLVSTLSEQMDGELRLTVDGGSKFELTFGVRQDDEDQSPDTGAGADNETPLHS